MRKIQAGEIEVGDQIRTLDGCNFVCKKVDETNETDLENIKVVASDGRLFYFDSRHVVTLLAEARDV